MSYRLIDANALNGVISNDDYEKVLNAPCIFVDLPNGLDGEHYNLQEPCTENIKKEAIEYIKTYRKLDEDLYNAAEKGSVAYIAAGKCLKYWDMAIQALSSWEKYSDKLWKEAYERGKAEALSQEPTVQGKQAESEKYQKAFDDGYENGYAQARFDYEQEPQCTEHPCLGTLCRYYKEPCDDAISRQAAIKIANCISKKAMPKYLEKLPPVTPSCDKCAMNGSGSKYCDSCGQKSGKWITVTNGRGGHECDICHEYAPSYQNGDEYLTKYCPNCGAKMQKGEVQE